MVPSQVEAQQRRVFSTLGCGDDMSFDIRMAPGLRIGPSRRGLRTAFGPKPTSVHLGSGRSGSGPFSYWADISAQEHHPQGTVANRPVDLAALDSRIRTAGRPAEIAEAAGIEAAIITAHLEPYPLLTSPVVAAPAAVDSKAVATELRSQALFRLGRRRTGARRRAGHDAADGTAAEVAQRREHAEGEYQATREEAATRYEALMANEPEDVLGALEAVFERGETPAAPIDCEGDTASVVLRLSPLSAVPSAKPVIPRKGKATLQARVAAERHELYLMALASGVVAVVRQTLATAPGLGQVRVLAVRPTGAPPGDPPLEAVYAGTFDARAVTRTAWTEAEPVAEIAAIPGRLLRLTHDGQVVAALDLDAEPEVAAVIDALAAALHPGPAA
jgi:hypothetical protein